MERTFIQLSTFSKYLDHLIDQGKISQTDFEKFEHQLLKDPQCGDVIPGCNGLRKIRLKGSHTGKRGGFRVDYLDFPEYGKIYMIVLYPKNMKEDLSAEEKKIICQKIKELKKEVSRG